MSPPDSRLIAGLEHARRGWYVFPAHSVANGCCSCGQHNCPSVAKHPRTPRGLHDATTDEAVIRSWFQRWPTANVAIRTGAVSGIVVIDEDTAKGGGSTLKAAQSRLGKLPQTLTALTGGGGRHYVFKHPGRPVACVRGESGLGTGLDVRGDGGYVIGPWSVHASGRSYVWMNDIEPAELPQRWVNELCGPAARRNGPAKQLAERIPEGRRHDALFVLACQARRWGCEANEIAALLTTVNSNRCEVPLPVGEVIALAADVARRYERSRAVMRGSSGSLVVDDSVLEYVLPGAGRDD